MAQEEQLFKLVNSAGYSEPDLDLTLLPFILNKEIQALLPSNNPSLAPIFSTAGSQIHFNNHAKLAEYSRLHDKYWKVYTKLVALIPTEKHQYCHQKVKNILKAAIFSDSRISNAYKKIFIEFLNSYEVLERKLFHWINPSYESLLSLYGSFNKNEYGIAISINDHYSIMGSNVILSIRNVHKSNIPIHVYYVGDTDLNPLNQNMLKSLASNVELHDLSTITDHNFIGAESFATKVYAQLLTPARHVMLLDADAVLLQSPEHIFSNPGYVSKGTLFFHDRQIFTPKPETVKWLVSLLPEKLTDSELPERLANIGWFTGKSEHIQESGMVLIDKAMHLTPLLATALLNKKVERELTYKRVWGDKETFWIGFEIIGRSYFFSPYEPHPIGGGSQQRGEGLYVVSNGKAAYESSKPHNFCSCHMLHFDHNTNPSWINGGLWVRKDRIDLGLADYDTYSWGPGQWELYEDGMWGCFKGEEGKTVAKSLEPELRAKLSEITILYANFYNNPIINPSKNL
ncbi:glycosyltransferase family 71 protein [Conidiobolus coronatus NRRL 28638]|uniref:Glycosyltransferase family 71 protein n=1 Tax=Conidiobolus coronatus (strain ATCC 28846 / CBS 209.66 / NRRL 28638) TaxID=796925 RepID=A0A137PDM5_CONC2|nr:glycosyltransferase family 71 protein [Conidiobolus coronatus NRRL 28638]|eukprot:KXN73106.1 glycosyltransferase family 71 protein [Conidiobolus coronatus NRRL 28638]